MSDMIQFNTSTAMAKPSDLVNLGAAASMTAGGGDTVDLLRLLRGGEWVFGADNTEPEEHSLWALNPYSFTHGYISWVDNRPAGEVMVSVLNPMPARAELPDTGGTWDEQMGFQLQCISGEDTGTVVMFKATSVGGKKAIGKLANKIAEQAAAGDKVVPVVKLGVDHYQHKQYGRIYTPDFAIQKWVAMDEDVTAIDSPMDDDTATPRRRRSAR